MASKACKTCGCEIDVMNIAMCVKCSSIICENCAITHKFKCGECAGVNTTAFNVDYIRRSHIEDYKDCAHYFYLNVVKGIEVPTNIYAHVGIDLHDLYDEWAKGKITDEEELRSKTLQASHKHRGNFDDELVDKMIDKAIRSTEGFLMYYPYMEHKLVTTEETLFFDVKEGLPKVRITMDMIREDEEGNLHILDYKTGKVMTGKHLATNLQVPLYIKAVQDNYGKPVKSFTLIYLSERERNGAVKTRKYEHVREDVYRCVVNKREYVQSISDAIKEVQAIFARIVAGKFNAPEKPNYFKCKTCYFKEIGSCANSDIQPWLDANGDMALSKGWK